MHREITDNGAREPIKQKEPKFKLPKNFNDRIDGFAALNLVSGATFFIIAVLLHAFMNPSAPTFQKDPWLVIFFLKLSGVFTGVGSLIFLTRVTFFLVDVIRGRKPF